MENIVKELRILHSALTMGALLILLIIGLILLPISTTEFDLTFGIYTIIGLGIGLINIALAYGIFQKKLDRLGSKQINQEVITEMRANYVTKWALLEGAALINIVLYFLEGNKLLIAFATIIILMLYLSKPRLTIDHA